MVGQAALGLSWPQDRALHTSQAARKSQPQSSAEFGYDVLWKHSFEIVYRLSHGMGGLLRHVGVNGLRFRSSKVHGAICLACYIAKVASGRPRKEGAGPACLSSSTL